MLHSRAKSAKLHSVSQSASGLREQRKQETLRRLAETARELAAARGLNGFTIEELCEEAGVSRRTFFNYFAAKEDAVLGFSLLHGDDEADEAFVAGGVDRRAGQLSPTVVDDLVDLFVGRWERMALTPSQAERVLRIVEQEPRLHTRIFQVMREAEQTTIALVERREDLAAGDVRAHTLVHVIGTLNRLVAEEYLAAHGDARSSMERFRIELRERAQIVRDLFA